MRAIVTTLLLAGAMASTALCDDSDFQWQGALKPGQLLEIRGLSGSIHADGTSDGTASVTAHKTAAMSDPLAVKIQAVPFDGGVVICAVYPDAGQSNPNICNPPGKDTYLNKDGKNDVQVQFTVKVPPGVRFTAITLKGDIEAISVTGDVDANTLDGKITISTTGTGQASTLHGSIVASIGSVNWSGLRSFTTSDGSVDLQIPADANVSVTADVFDGSVISDFPLMITTAPFGRFGRASGTIGTDGRSLRLFAGHGNITIHSGPPSGS